MEYVEIDYLSDDFDIQDFNIPISHENAAQDNDYPKRKTKEIKKSKKFDGFSSDQKKRLCELVKMHTAIWDLTDKLHKNHHAVTSSWKQVAEAMEATVDDCKGSWKSLKDSLRYHKGRAKKATKSGSGFDIDDLDESQLEDEMDWEFGKNLSFLISASSESRRRTFSTDTNSNNQYDDNEDTSCSSNYTYMSKKPKTSATVTGVEKLSSSINELISMKKSQQISSAPKPYQQKNEIMLNNIDKMLQKLPDNIVDEFNFKFQIQIMEEIKRNKI